MNKTEIHEAVQAYYANQIKSDAPCCGTDACCSNTGRLYPAELLEILPAGEGVVSFGCGDPITLAGLQEGQTVLDLGSGAGLDCFFAAQMVGEGGHVIGVDMTAEMIERARASAGELKLGNVEFRHGYLEDLPVESGSVDVVISNCVINLAPDKGRVFAEAFRVLKPGGKLAVADVLLEAGLTEEVRNSLSDWAGCVAGAVEAKEYVGMMESAGFRNVSIEAMGSGHVFDARIRGVKP